MHPAQVAQLARCLARPEVRAFDAPALGALARNLRSNPPLVALPHGTVIAYAVGARRRRVLEVDRGGEVVSAYRWRSDGSLAWLVTRTAADAMVGLEPGGGEHAAWGRSDRIWRVTAAPPWEPREPVTVLAALDWARLARVPPLADPARLPPQAGTALLNAIAGLMQDQSVSRCAYEGPYPSEQLFTALLESFHYDAAAPPLEAFLAGEAVHWIPAPHERYRARAGLVVQLRESVDKVVLDGQAFYRRDWQGVERREPRVVRAVDGRVVCSLWALDRSLEDRAVLDARGQVLELPAPVADERAPAPMAPVWRRALAALVARDSAPALGEALREVLDEVGLEWGPVPGDLLRGEPGALRVARRLRDAGAAFVAEAAADPTGEARAQRAVRVVLEVARLLGPELRQRAQARLAALPEAEQQRRWDAAAAAPPPPLDDSVSRLVALVAAGGG
jgi:hypothetical protein